MISLLKKRWSKLGVEMHSTIFVDFYLLHTESERHSRLVAMYLLPTFAY